MMMTDDHKMRVACAIEFGELKTGLGEVRGEIKRVANGHDVQADALEKLTTVVERATDLRRQEHDETIRLFMGNSSQVLSLVSTATERVAVVEQKSASAHHRIDGFVETVDKKFERIMSLLRGIAISIAGGAGLAVILATIRYLTSQGG